MNWLKRIPVHYKGELHDVRLINFSVELEEVTSKVPYPIQVRNFGGRALISMVDVKLKNMRAVAVPFARFHYRHIAFRLLVEDSHYNHGVNKGIYFLRAFTNKPLIVAGGNLMTDYKLGLARIDENGDNVLIRQGDNYLHYSVDSQTKCMNTVLENTVGAIDRAYSVFGERLRVTEIQREKWPIQEVNCIAFENTFFRTARVEGAFRVFETIYYDWLPPEPVHQ